MNKPLARIISAFVLGLFLGLGIWAAGCKLGTSILGFKKAGRFVTVKGLAEKDVLADFAILPIGFTASGNNLRVLNAKIDADTHRVLDFLRDRGHKLENIEMGPIKVHDDLANEYQSNQPRANRYILTKVFNVVTQDIQRVLQTSRELDTLVRVGIVLSANNMPRYLFKDINSIKPELLKVATQNARKSAAQFAQDSGAKVGSIRQANQGTIVIRDRHSAYSQDQSTHKVVRIISTISYFLEDQ